MIQQDQLDTQVQIKQGDEENNDNMDEHNQEKQEYMPDYQISMKQNVQHDGDDTIEEDNLIKMKNLFQRYPEPTQKKNRIVGIILLIVQIAVIVVDEIFGRFYPETEPIPFKFIDTITVVLHVFLALVGFGLVLEVYRYANGLGVATSIIVFATSSQINPLLMTLWQFVFLKNITSGFPNSIPSTGRSFQFLQHITMQENKFLISSYSYRIFLLSCTSFLTFMVATIGRLAMFQIFKLILVFQIVWTANFALLIRISVLRDTTITDPKYFDIYGSSYSYLLAASFGIPFCLIVRKNILPVDHYRNMISGYSWQLSSMGTGFIFATFVFGASNFLDFQDMEKGNQRLSIFFALCGSIVGSYCGSYLANKRTIGHKDALIGTIMGGISIGSTAPLIRNPGYAMISGLVSSTLSGLLNKKISSKINKNFMYDVLGLFTPFLISSLLGSLVVPIVNIVLFTHETANIAYICMYAGISAGIGVVGGILGGLVCRWDDDGYGSGTVLKFFSAQQVLEPRLKELRNKPSAQEENKQQQIHDQISVLSSSNSSSQQQYRQAQRSGYRLTSKKNIEHPKQQQIQIQIQIQMQMQGQRQMQMQGQRQRQMQGQRQRQKQIKSQRQ